MVLTLLTIFLKVSFKEHFVLNTIGLLSLMD